MLRRVTASSARRATRSWHVTSMSTASANFSRPLPNLFALTVVDCGNGMEPWAFKVFEYATAIFVVTTADLIVINQTKRVLSKIQELLFPPEMVQIIVNRYSQAHIINPQMIQKNLNRAPFRRDSRGRRHLRRIVGEELAALPCGAEHPGCARLSRHRPQNAAVEPARAARQTQEAYGRRRQSAGRRQASSCRGRCLKDGAAAHQRSRRGAAGRLDRDETQDPQGSRRADGSEKNQHRHE